MHYWSKTLTKFIGERDRLVPERIFDLSYVELRRDPIGAVRRIYKHFGWVLSPRAENRVREVLAKQPCDLQGFHRYEASPFGLRPEHEQAFLADYSERFSVGAPVSACS